MADRAFSDHSFAQYLSEDKLMGVSCKACGASFVPPRPICTSCHSTDLSWKEFPGTGTLAGFSVIYYGTPAMGAQGFDRKNPYISAVVELDGGGRVDARIEGVDTSAPEKIKLGQALKIKFLHQGEGDEARTDLAFEPK